MKTAFHCAIFKRAFVVKFAKTVFFSGLATKALIPPPFPIKNPLNKICFILDWEQNLKKIPFFAASLAWFLYLMVAKNKIWYTLHVRAAYKDTYLIK